MKHYYVGLLDCNNFFVSCERLFRPDLLGKPVVVLSSNDGCVVARSQEVKDIGVPMGVPYFKIKDIIQEHKVEIFSSHFALYRDISRRVFSTMREVLDEIEEYSIDEAFFTISSETEEPETVLKEIKDKVEKQVGVPVSLGLGLSKTQAKVANDIAKKNTGVYHLRTDDWMNRSRDMKLSSIWGVGYRLAKQYQSFGVSTVAEYMDLSEQLVRERFGIVGWRLWRELHGNSSGKLRTNEQKTIMSTRSFPASITELAPLEEAVKYHVENIARELRTKKLAAREIRVFIAPSRHGDFVLHGASKEIVLAVPSNNSFLLVREAMAAVRAMWKAGVPYKKAGAIASGLQSEEIQTKVLFEEEKEDKEAGLLAILDSITDQNKRPLLTLGGKKHSAKWQARQNLLSPDYTTRWESIAEVKA